VRIAGCTLAARCNDGKHHLLQQHANLRLICCLFFEVREHMRSNQRNAVGCSKEFVGGEMAAGLRA